MVLRYMVSDTDLVKGELIKKPEKEVLQPRRKDVQPKRNRPSSKKSVKFRLFLMVIVILGIAVYYLWTADLTSSNLESSPTNKEEVLVTSIVYSEQNASAVISNIIVHNGDMVDGYKVVKIHRDIVEFEKDGESYTKHVKNLRIPLTQRLINIRNSIRSTVSNWKRQLEIKL
ncbi:MAG TPA: hypothetical protein VMW72_17005 [Sedimentisphaerales bacterium]|nr:hypothetical protein [Sedimentisphaerales bacterium]